MNTLLVAYLLSFGPRATVYPVADAPAVVRFVNTSVKPVSGRVVAVPVGTSRVLVLAPADAGAAVDAVIQWLEN